MSEVYENQKTLRQLRSQIEDLKPVDGEKFYFACVYFLPYEDGYTLFISKDKINISNIFLQDRAETQKEICYNLKEYFKVIEQGRFKRD